jgi:hypothetical protein
MKKTGDMHRSTRYRHQKAARAALGGMPAAAPEDDRPWGEWIRSRYELDRNEAELVRLAEIALTVANDATERSAERLQAASRFQSLIKQLALEDAVRG